MGRLLVSRRAEPASVDVVLVLVNTLGVRVARECGDFGSGTDSGGVAGASAGTGSGFGGAAMVAAEGSGVADGIGLPGFQSTSVGMGRCEWRVKRAKDSCRRYCRSCRSVMSRGEAKGKKACGKYRPRRPFSSRNWWLGQCQGEVTGSGRIYVRCAVKENADILSRQRIGAGGLRGLAHGEVAVVSRVSR